MPSMAMVAGPNGSGKTTLTDYLLANGFSLRNHINPDEVAAKLSGSYRERSLAAQKLAETRRRQYLADGASFSFETVMSHPSKVAFLREAVQTGYDTLLYFVATSRPELNVARVAQRVAAGGHDVPRDRIIQRYHRALDLLPQALSVVHRAYVYDNSTAEGLRLCMYKEPRFGDDHYGLVETEGPDWVANAFHAARLLAT